MARYLYDSVGPECLTLVVIFDYDRRSNGELSVKAGDVVEVSMEDRIGHWIEVKNKDGDIGYLPLAYLAKPNTLEAMPWYFHELSRNEAIELLIREEPGTYLVRPSSTEKECALSVRTKNPEKLVVHYKIRYHETKGFFIHVQLPNISISRLLSFYQNDVTNKLNMEQRLLKICPKSTPRIFQLSPRNQPINPDEIKLLKIIGSGHFGSVQLGLYRQFKVAIKTLLEYNQELWEKELTPLRVLMHPNVVTCYGYCKAEQWIIFEFVDHCLLNRLIEKVYTDIQLLVITTQIARGMAYIHKMNYVHRDLAARNVLVTIHLQAKISDFGLSRALKSNNGAYCSKSLETPIFWEALESLTTRAYNKFTDVWMFGALLYEIYNAGVRPFKKTRSKEDLIELLKKGQRPEKQPGMPQPIYDLQMKCMNKEPKKRPDFEKVLKFYINFE